MPADADRPPLLGAVHPTPTDEEAAAIAAAVEVAWPRAVAPTDDRGIARWRFSGRWWSKPLPARRERP